MNAIDFNLQYIKNMSKKSSRLSYHKSGVVFANDLFFNDANANAKIEIF